MAKQIKDALAAVVDAPTSVETPTEQAVELESTGESQVAVEDVASVVEEVDLTEVLSDDEIQSLFDAFSDEDWAEVDALIDSFEANGTYEKAVSLHLEVKEGGADRNRGGAEKLRRYWTVGEGAAKIRWGQPGDWTRCVEHLGKYLGERAKGYCALRHKEMDGFYPGDSRNKSDSSAGMQTADLYHESKQADVPDLGDTMFEHKTVGVKGLNVVDAAQGIVETVISVTGIVDNVKDKIKPGAYTKTLATRTPKGVWSHDWNEPVSKTLDVKELLPGDPELPSTMPNGNPWPKEAGALKVKTQFNLDTQRGREAFSDVVFFGSEQEWSIGYQVPVGGAKVDPQSGVREIDFLELYEYSPVLFGAMPLARTASVKDAQMAFKALMESGAASWVQEAAAKEDPAADAVVDDVPEEVVEYGEDDADDVDDVEGKSALDGDQMILVKSAIQTLTDLLAAVEAEYKVAEDIEGPDDMEDGEDEGDDDYASLVEAVDDIAGNCDCHDDLADAADQIDNAIADDDDAALESGTTAFLDVIEKNMGGEDDDALKELSQILADMIEQVSDMGAEDQQEEAPSEDTMDTKEDMCPDCGMPMSECKCGKEDAMDKKADVIDADEIKSLLASFKV